MSKREDLFLSWLGWMLVCVSALAVLLVILSVLRGLGWVK